MVTRAAIVLVLMFSRLAAQAAVVHQTNSVSSPAHFLAPQTMQDGEQHRWTISVRQGAAAQDLSGSTSVWIIADLRDGVQVAAIPGQNIDATGGVVRFATYPPNILQVGQTYSGVARAYNASGELAVIGAEYITLAEPYCSTCKVVIVTGGGSGSTTNVTADNLEANSPGVYAQQGGAITAATLTVGSAEITGLGTTNIAVGGVRTMLAGESAGGAGFLTYYAGVSVVSNTHVVANGVKNPLAASNSAQVVRWGHTNYLSGIAYRPPAAGVYCVRVRMSDGSGAGGPFSIAMFLNGSEWWPPNPANLFVGNSSVSDPGNALPFNESRFWETNSAPTNVWAVAAQGEGAGFTAVRFTLEIMRVSEIEAGMVFP